MCIWGTALFWAVGPLNAIQWGRYTIEPFGTGCLLDFGNRDVLYLIYIFLMVTVVFVFPVGAMIYCALQNKVTDSMKVFQTYDTVMQHNANHQ